LYISIISCQQVLDVLFEELTFLKRYRIAGIENRSEEKILTKKIFKLHALRTVALDHFEDAIAPQFASNFPPTLKPKCPEKHRIIILEKKVARQEKKVYI